VAAMDGKEPDLLPRRPQMRPEQPQARALRQMARWASRLDLYHRLLTIGWGGFFALLAVAYIVFNFVFGVLYWLQADSIANAHPSSLSDAFFFSVQTMATIGYGSMYPATFYANVVVTIEMLLGLTGFALATGLIFARFSRPTARVMFSRVAVITRHDGQPMLMFRAANQRRNRILDATVTLTLARNEVTAEGEAMRRFYELEPERRRTQLFSLSWTMMHRITAASPLHGIDHDALLAVQGEVLVTLNGIDETLAQTVYARHSYRAEDIQWDRRLADILTQNRVGPPSVDYARFHDTVEAAD
jgi:inward rectifier potassium channel